MIVAPIIKKLKAIVFKTVPKMSAEGCRPYFEITNNITDDILYTNRDFEFLPYHSTEADAMLIDFDEGDEPILFGDLQF